MRTVLQVGLLLIAAVLTYYIYDSIQRPIAFDKLRTERYNVTIERLKDIRKAQLAYKDVNGRFTGSWDTLIHFVKYDSIRSVRKIGNLTDSMVEKGISERRAMQLGLIIRDTIRSSVLDELFEKNFNPELLKVVPLSDTLAYFSLGANLIVTGSGISVPVFEARVHNNVLLRELDRQLVINLNDQRRVQNRYPGLKVGSLTETNNNAGNWE